MLNFSSNRTWCFPQGKNISFRMPTNNGKAALIKMGQLDLGVKKWDAGRKGTLVVTLMDETISIMKVVE